MKMEKMVPKPDSSYCSGPFIPYKKAKSHLPRLVVLNLFVWEAGWTVPNLSMGWVQQVDPIQCLVQVWQGSIWPHRLGGGQPSPCPIVWGKEAWPNPNPAQWQGGGMRKSQSTKVGGTTWSMGRRGGAGVPNQIGRRKGIWPSLLGKGGMAQP